MATQKAKLCLFTVCFIVLVESKITVWLPEEIEPVEILIATPVMFEGTEYTTLDGTSPRDNTQRGCSKDYLSLPSGWQLAEKTTAAQQVVRMYPWGTAGMVFSDGTALCASQIPCVINADKQYLQTTGLPNALTYRIKLRPDGLCEYQLRILISRKGCVLSSAHQEHCQYFPFLVPSWPVPNTVLAIFSGYPNNQPEDDYRCGCCADSEFVTDLSLPYFGARRNLFDYPHGMCKCRNGYELSIAGRCEKCEAGKYFDKGLSWREYGGPSANEDPAIWGTNKCKNCAVGKYQTQAGQSSCALAVSSEVCAIGKYGVPPNCDPCPMGYTTLSTGSTVMTDCVCKQGYYPVNVLAYQQCIACAAGTYKSQTGQGLCTECAAGKSQAQSGQSACIACAVAKYQAQTGQGLCTACAAGKYQTQLGQSDCIACAEGKYKAETGQGSCTECAAGTYASSSQALCTPCPPHWYGTERGQNTCIECAAGKYQTQLGQTVCDLCRAEIGAPCRICDQPGEFSRNGITCITCTEGKQRVGNTGDCENCPVGKFGGMRGACTSCPLGKTTMETGSQYTRNCVCAPGYEGLSDSECSACAKGKYGQYYDSMRSSWSCLPCAVGKYNDLFGQSVCQACQPGKYNENEGQNVCAECAKGKYGKDYGATVSSWSCLPCAVGKYNDLFGQSVCQACQPGKYNALAEQTYCENCKNGKYNEKNGSTSMQACEDCTAGEYSYSYEPNGNSYVINNVASSNAQCTNCPRNRYTDKDGQDTCAQCAIGKFSYEGSTNCSSCPIGYYLNSDFLKSHHACLKCADCEEGKRRVACKHDKYLPGNCIRCKPGFIIAQIDQDECTACAAGKYQHDPMATKCLDCPPNSNSPEGSATIRYCVCARGWVQRYYNGEVICTCKAGHYVQGIHCLPCKSCDSNASKNIEYRSGCIDHNEGTCEVCDTVCADGEKLAGCGGLSAGECKPASLLVPTPQCAIEETATISGLAVTGFGIYDFVSVFRAKETEVDFRCSDPCDGRRNYDSQQCDGPYACNMRTCAADTQEVYGMIPVRACPVIITAEDMQHEDVIALKRNAKCVPCDSCGTYDEESGTRLHKDWGAGCARECSQLQCTQGQIWDWTERKCSECQDLRNMKLCSRKDIELYELESSKVTGNWPLLFFEGCQGSGAALLTDIGIGRCSACEKHYTTCSAVNEYPHNCIDFANVRCGVCSRARHAEYFSLLKGRWFNSKARSHEELHCQISACTHRVGGMWTGVTPDGTLCHKPCLPQACREDQVAIPCRLPHQARCESGYPMSGNVPTTQLYLNSDNEQVYAGGEVNLLNEENEMSSRGFASFENILIVLDELNEYQCVWNAEGITDNVATPAGSSQFFWASQETSQHAHKHRGTRACRIWDVDDNVAMPMLPLQNTVSCSTEENSTSNCLDRIILVNTEAYAVSYGFNGHWNVPEMPPIEVTWNDHDQDPELPKHADFGGRGLLFLLLCMHQKYAKLAVDVPHDRSLHKASWLRAVLVSYFSVDATEYLEKKNHAKVRVRPYITVDGESVNDAHDLFVPEFLWKQPVSADSLQDADSLFLVKTEAWISNWTSCADLDVSDVIRFEIAPRFNESASLTLDNGYGFTKQVWASPTMYKVSYCCTNQPLNSLQIDICRNVVSNCDDLVRQADVFVLQRPYKHVATSIDACNGPAWTCTKTKDETLLGLRHVHTNIRSAPVADRHNPMDAEKVVYQIKSDSITAFSNIQQVHTGDPYSLCPIIATNANSIRCYGTKQPQLLHEIAVGTGNYRYLSAFQSLIDTQYILLVLLAGNLEKFSSGRLYWHDDSLNSNNTISSTILALEDTGLTEVMSNDPDVANWISVAAVDDSVVALLITNLNLHIWSVRKYSLSWQMGDTQLELTLENEESEQIDLPGSWPVNVEPEEEWLRFCKLAAPREVSHFLLACVQKPDEDSLILRVCLGPRQVSNTGQSAICNDHALDIDAAEKPAYISTAFLRNDSAHNLTHTSFQWVVGVHGNIFIAYYFQSKVTEHFTQPLEIERVRTSDLVQKHFVKTDHLFFNFRLAETTSFEVLTYLPDFELLKPSTTTVTVPAAYAVVLVRRDSLQTPSYASSTNVEDKRLILNLESTSYIVHKYGEAALPVYERNSEEVDVNEVPELLMSKHKVSVNSDKPSSFLAKYSQAPGQLGAWNRALGLPVAVGRFQILDNQCVFADWSNGYQIVENRLKNPYELTSTRPRGLVLEFNSIEMLLVDAGRWLLLQFKVPCGQRLRPYQRLGTACGLADVEGLEKNFLLEPDCAPYEHVVALLDATRERETTVYFLDESKTIKRLSLTPCNCIYLDRRVFWVDGAMYESKPREYEIHARLMHLLQPALLSQPTLLSQQNLMSTNYVLSENVAQWRRERHVMRVTPRQHMRLELHVERDVIVGTDVEIRVGVDDIQLTPVLSSFPVFKHTPDKWCTRVHVPSALQLADIGLEHLVLGRDGMQSDDWARVQGTVSLDVRGRELVDCIYKTELFLMQDDCGSQEADEEPDRLQYLGCTLKLQEGGIGLYAECQVELPAYLDRDHSTGIGILLLNHHQRCRLPEDASFFVSLRPHTKLYSCSPGEFLGKDGNCENCHKHGGHDICQLGQRLRGCPALEKADEDNCVPCTEGRDLVLKGVASWASSNSTHACRLQCNGGYFLREHLGVGNCILCQEELPCGPGLTWQNCSYNQDSGCYACSSLWPLLGQYAQNEEYFNHSNTCQTRCKDNHYRDARGRCKECWDRSELLMSQDPGFYYFENCTHTTNALIIPCEEKQGSEIVGHEVGFTGDCERKCKKGWVKQENKCTPCTSPPLVANGTYFETTSLPPEAFDWIAESANCTFKCLHPYVDVPLSDSNNASCTRCDVCEIGQYPEGPFCACNTCLL